MQYGTATVVFLNLQSPEISYADKLEAIETISRLDTHNGYKKDLFIGALRWIFDHFDFDTGEAAKRNIRLLKGGGEGGK